MIALSLSEVVDAVAGSLSDSAAGDGVVLGSVVHDSRIVRPGDLFFAIRGERHDGHEYAEAALAAGAIAAVVDDPAAADRRSGATVLVDDAVEALGLLAAQVLRRLPGLDVIAVTGSSGKTSTKDLLAAVLGAFGPTIAPAGSLNNDIGLPMTVLSVDESTRYLVLEMGARARGDVSRLCRAAPPDVGVVLNVGSAHAGVFGSVAETAAAKSELVSALSMEKVAVLNADDPEVLGMAGATEAQVVTFGRSPSADIRVVDLQLDDLARARFGLVCRGERVDVRLRVSGAHQAINAAAVAAACDGLGLPMADVAAVLGRAAIASTWRMDVVRVASGAIVINDTYNANPESVKAALRALARMGRSRTSWAVLGEMRELGDLSAAAHHEVGRVAAHLGIDRVVAVGEAARPIATGAASEGLPSDQAVFVDDSAAALAVLAERMLPGDVVLVKASRALALERLAANLIAAHGGSVGTVDDA